MAIELIADTKDLRTNTRVVYAQMSINDYLNLVGDNFDKFAIQRRREKHKAYARMKKDISLGALLPPVALAIDPEIAPKLLDLYETGTRDAFLAELAKPGQVSILDGLQRTYTLDDLRREGQVFPDEHKLLVELWLEGNFKHLIYRIIVLNAGQKPMSMRHQIEILFATFKKNLESEIPDLDLFEEKDDARRTKARKFALDRVVSAYQSFLSRSPEIQKENVVAQSLVEEEILAESEEALSAKFDDFKAYLLRYASLDDEVCRVYDGSLGAGILRGTNWFGGENVMNSFFAAVADFGVLPERLERTNTALKRLHESLHAAEPGTDPLNLLTLQRIVEGFPIRKVNVGFATRKLLFSSFKEFFRDEGDSELGTFWAIEAE